ncbi:MAG TPA: SDR family oxidoreductase [Thiobacillaceae bacterium]|nr:SDR family oxidoreductase [Thiobacillaceae bacterium]
MPGTNKRPVVFITGAGSGLGRALAHLYGQRGAKLGLLGRRAGPLQDLAAQYDARVYLADVRDARAMQAAARAFIEQAGVPDIVIGSAGISVGTLTEHAEDLPVFQAVMDANLMGLVHAFHPFIQEMSQRGSGTLCGIASVAGVRGLAGGGAYSASKAAVRVYLESLRLELRSRGIAVVTVAPGYIDTQMTRVNTYPMPFRMTAESAAHKVARAIRLRRRYTVIPWQMSLVERILKHMPGWIYDRLFEHAKRKPRGLPT